MAKNRKNYKKEIKLITVLVGLIFAYFLKMYKQDNYIDDNNVKVEINEQIVLKEYKDNNKKNINDISFDDYRSLNISKKKIDNILEYKKYMGSINKIDDLKNIPRISYDDIDKLKIFFVDNDKPVYIKHNINKMTVKQLKYLGFSNKEIKKILKYRNKKTINNLIELEEIIGKKYKNSSISF
ncbi:helix-hairpin-helix domain-containing protein [Oceanivirga salmonicida]|uniref:hypothetical protein n=1 Tax=Oceanivirga salmonicida TaxID=1769291 RepID=UPI00082BB839|nr:hypothetical protein [Oceanivirga salmonicida]